MASHRTDVGARSALGRRRGSPVTVGDQAEAYVAVLEHLGSIAWYLEEMNRGRLDLATVVGEVFREARGAVGAVEEGRL